MRVKITTRTKKVLILHVDTLKQTLQVKSLQISTKSLKRCPLPSLLV